VRRFHIHNRRRVVRGVYAVEVNIMSMNNASSMVLGMTVVVGICAAAGAQCQVAKFVHLDGARSDEFGSDVSFGSDTRVYVGAPGDNVGGSAWVYSFDGEQWRRSANFYPEDPWIYDNFGQSVAGTHWTVAVAAPGKQTISIYNSYPDGLDWTLQTTLVSPWGNAGTYFGKSLAMEGRWLAVGEEAPDHNGRVYLYRDMGASGWTLLQVIELESNPTSLAMSASHLLVGTQSDDSGANNGGTAHVYKREEAYRWVHEAKLMAHDVNTAARFGHSVALGHSWAVIGAYQDDGGAGHASHAGAAYMFEYVDSQWIERDKLIPSDARRTDEFGSSVAITNDQTVVVGAVRGDGNEHRSGCVYVFDENEGYEWLERGKLMSSHGDTYDAFGSAVAIRGDQVLVGAAYGDSGIENDTGTAYIIDTATNCDPCPADFDGNGEVDMDDLYDFTDAFDSGDPTADFNGDGTINSQDFVAFLSAFVAGC
jgi:hypothetical protein